MQELLPSKSEESNNGPSRCQTARGNCVVWFQHSLREGQFCSGCPARAPILCPYSGLPMLNTAISKGQGRELSNTTCLSSHFTTRACLRSLGIGLTCALCASLPQSPGSWDRGCIWVDTTPWSVAFLLPDLST